MARQDATAPQLDSRSRFRVVGGATLTHEFGRTWTASAVYVRRFLFREGFADPFFSDGVTAALTGLVSRRLEFAAQASWSLSTYQGATGGQHRGDWGIAQLRYALSRHLAAYTRYVYYHYRFSDQLLLDEDFASAMNRQGIRVGVTMTVPLM
jgi:hypothetical protein